MLKKSNPDKTGVTVQVTKVPQPDGDSPVLTDSNREKRIALGDKKEKKLTVEMSWTVKSRAAAGEVDLDASCLVFNKLGRYVETVFWDNLQAKGITHLGDEKLDEEDDSSDHEGVDDPNQNSQTENIEVNFSKLHEEVSHLVFVLNIFNNKTFANLIKIDYKLLFGGNVYCRYTVPTEKFKKIRDNNALIIAKIFKKKEVQNDWFVRILSNPQSIPFGQVVDVLIPCILREKEDKKQCSSLRMVEPLVPTWEKITIEILEGRGLAAADINGRSDPYVKLECGHWKHKTRVKKETLNPVWTDAKFELQFSETEEKDITFLVKDHDRVGKNDFIGQFQVSIAKIPPNKEINRWFRIQPPENPERNTTNTRKKSEKTYGSIYVRLHKHASNDH